MSYSFNSIDQLSITRQTRKVLSWIENTSDNEKLYIIYKYTNYEKVFIKYKMFEIKKY